MVLLANTSSTYKPFSVQEAIGDTTPTQPLPPAPVARQGGGCGGLGQVLMVVVAIVVTYFTAGAAAGYFAPAAGAGGTAAGGITVAGVSGLTATQAVAAAAIGGAAGSAASQLVGIATGNLQGFDWRGVAMGAVGGAVTAGLGLSSGWGKVLERAGNFAPALNTAANSLVTQGIGVATGLQSSFSWRNVALSAVAAPVANYIGNAVAGSANAFAGQVAAGLAGSAVRLAMGGKIEITSVIADAFGNAIGNSMVDRMASVAGPAGTNLQATRNIVALGSSNSAGQLEEVQITARRLDNNPGAVFRPDFSMSPDEIRAAMNPAEEILVSAPKWDAQQNALYDRLVAQGYSEHGAALFLDHNRTAAVALTGINGPVVDVSGVLRGIDQMALRVHDAGYAAYERGDHVGASQLAVASFATDYLAHLTKTAVSTGALLTDPGAQVSAARAFGDAVRNPAQAASKVWSDFSQLDTRQQQFAVMDVLAGGRGLGVRSPAVVDNMIQKGQRIDVQMPVYLDARPGEVYTGLPPVGFQRLFVSNESPLTYDISKWGEYGLPSDGYFVRSLTQEQYVAMKNGLDTNFGGMSIGPYSPLDANLKSMGYVDPGYPNGMGFMGSAEQLRGITTRAAYKEATQLDYDPPKYLVEFQLRDPTGLNNALQAPYSLFEKGGTARGTNFSEFNYWNLSSREMQNPVFRELK